MPYIEKIEMKGFKSYGNKKVVVPLSRGFTAIVGANGSGKSNIGDALLFVLGGLSAKAMRATRISDLLFAGNKSEPPAKYAEVAVYFNNEDRGFPIDEDEVVIKRRVYPDGRSAYWLNGKRATRSEILDLLSAAMISPEGYNLVLQGDITKFIKMSPLERRLLIDEISGIAEYDAKKEKALEELKQAEENLARVDLLINEVKKQLDKLEKERNDALRYLNLKEKVEKARVALLLGEIKRLEGLLKEGMENGFTLESEIEKTEEALKNLVGEIIAKERELSSVEREIEEKSGSGILEVNRKISEVKSRLEVARRNIENAQKEIDESQRRLVKAKEELKRVSDEIEKGTGAIARWSKRREKLVADIKEKETARNELLVKLGEIDRSYAIAREEFDRVVGELEDAKKELYTRETEVKKFEEEIERARAKIVQATVRKKALKEAIEESRKALEAKKSELTEIEGRMERAQGRLKKAEKELEERTNALKKVEKELAGAKEELIKAEAQTEVRGNRAVEFLKSQQIPGLYGTLGELISVPDSAYAIAVEVALGGNYDNVVVEDDRVAEKAITLLKERKLGRLTFLPLNKIRPRSMSERPKLGTPAMEVVQYDPKFQKAVAYALGDTLIVGDMEEARTVGIGNVRMVTLGGELLEKSGAITGGHYKPRGMFGVNVDELKKKVERLEREREALESAINALKVEIRSIENELFELRMRKSDVNKDLEVLQRDLERLLREDRGIDEEVRSTEGAIESLSAKIEEYRGEMAKLRGRIERLEKTREKLKKALENPEARELNAKIREVEAEIAKLREELSGVESRLESLNSMINGELLPRKADLEEEINGLVNRINALRANIKENEEAVKKLEAELEELERVEERVKDELRGLRERRESLRNEIAELRERKDELTNKLQEMRIQANTLKIKLAQYEAELKERQAELGHFDGKLIKSIKPEEIPEPEKLEELKKEIERMEEEIRSLEPVNMKAIEDFEAVERRYMELSSKREQVLAEKESIEEFIAEIEGQKREVFMKTLNEIAKNFSELFAKLSPGGSARLILENTEDPFNGGLEIEAKPAGKDVKRIEAMSGGEKALTALAFVFAIQRYKPAPFYLFDEIDAHLDDANVKRVADLIKESSQSSQFIVITLRDVMMANADKIIGVSMRDGISRVVSLSLEKAMKILEEARKKSYTEHEEMFGHLAG
ncbi:chromosome segregation protein SMC [Thermococcus waiotapuensis]|uniref:Chromosome partition protein Smc n=1 Tax=Thermococcus waiotapuensis TaxID=90909 RepID=A0AAE4NVF5_9EURY|nr:chromosome segregation protein SMC [Thermococcus waiotapuensis]MDV3103366.1 chromosome segregation protein SMC [Thermococcus waiotapuensis]